VAPGSLLEPLRGGVGCRYVPRVSPLAAENIRNLPIPDLAVAVLRDLGSDSTPNPNNTLRRVEQQFHAEPDVAVLRYRVASAWAWLEGHALVGPSPSNTLSQWQVVTELGREVAEDPHAVAKVWADDRLDGGLDPLLSSARTNFALGDYEVAVKGH
jgi:hypothetical protein